MHSTSLLNHPLVDFTVKTSLPEFNTKLYCDTVTTYSTFHLLLKTLALQLHHILDNTARLDALI